MTQLLTIVQQYSLPIFMVVGVAGFVFCMLADYIKNKDLKKLSQEPIPFDEDGNYVKQKLPNWEIILSFNITGFILMFASLFALWHYGYFDKYLAMLFG